MRIFFALLLFVAGPAVFADTMRCGNHIVRHGDPQITVRDLCGEPSDVQSHYIQRRPSYQRNGTYYYFGNGFVDVPVEVWTYNLGPYKLMRRVRFVDGLVEDIDTLGYGYNAPGY